MSSSSSTCFSLASLLVEVEAGLVVSSDDDRECILPPEAPRVDRSGEVDADTLLPLLMLPPAHVMVDERDLVCVRTAVGGCLASSRVSSLREGGNRDDTPASI